MATPSNTIARTGFDGSGWLGAHRVAVLPSVPAYRRLVRALGATSLALVLAATGCGEERAGESASLRDFQAMVVDESGLVSDWEFHIAQEIEYPDEYLDDYVDDGLVDFEIVRLRPAAGWDVRIGWAAGSCHEFPIVHIIGRPGEIQSVLVDRGPVAVELCNRGRVSHKVDLRTDASFTDVPMVVVADDSAGSLREIGAPGGLYADPPSPSPGAATAAEGPAGWDIRLEWPALSCQLRPHIRLAIERTGSGELGRIEVDPGPRLAMPDCSEQVQFALDLRAEVDDPSTLIVETVS